MPVVPVGCAAYTVAVEHRFLDGREWRPHTWRSREDEIALTGVPVTVRVAELYELVEL
ncbi:MAG TPA: hypothetical protein VFP80_18060 [Thermoanaerobaculia bacterium]|nr:hypothetical protein [Thermoanaerobaculia bacterium]